MALEITDSNFEEIVLKGKTPVLVDFWAKWCGPCRALAPVIDEISKAFEGKVVVGKLEVDENPDNASKYGIRSIPTLMLFKNGEMVEQIVGGANKEAVEKLLNSHI